MMRIDTKILRRLSIVAISVLMSCSGPQSSKVQKESPQNLPPKAAAIMPLTEQDRFDQNQASAKAEKVLLMVAWNGQNLPSPDVVLSFYTDTGSEPFWVVPWSELLGLQQSDPGCAGPQATGAELGAVLICGGRLQNPTTVKRIVARDPHTTQTLNATQPGVSLLPNGDLNMLALFY